MTGDDDAVVPLADCERCGGTRRVIGRIYDNGPMPRRGARVRAVTAVPCPVCCAPQLEPPADVDE